MTLRKLASAIAKVEGKKSVARIGDIREILKIISTMEAQARAYESVYPEFDFEEESPIAALLADAVKKGPAIEKRVQKEHDKKNRDRE